MDENVVEWFTNQNKISCTFSQKKFVNKAKRLKESSPDDVDLIENNDGSVFVKMPISYLKFNKPRVVSDERRETLARQREEYNERKKIKGQEQIND